jgi:hypothetical protein
VTGQMDSFEGRLAYARYLATNEGRLEEYLTFFVEAERKRLEARLHEATRTASTPPAGPEHPSRSLGRYLRVDRSVAKIREMADRERERAADGTPEARSYYQGVADGLAMAADYLETQAEPISVRIGRLPHRRA